MRFKYTFPATLVIATSLFSLIWWGAHQKANKREAELYDFFREHIDHLSKDTRQAEKESVIFQTKPYGYNLYQIYCPPRSSPFKIAFVFGERRFLLLHFSLSDRVKSISSKVAMEGTYLRASHSLALSSSDGKRAMVIPFVLKKLEDFYTNYLNFFGELLHPSHCGKIQSELLFQKTELLQFYPKSLDRKFWQIYPYR